MLPPGFDPDAPDNTEGGNAPASAAVPAAVPSSPSPSPSADSPAAVDVTLPPDSADAPPLPSSSPSPAVINDAVMSIPKAKAKDEPWKWTNKRAQAALLLGQNDRMREHQIAAAVGVSRQSLAAWKRYPEFRERVDHHFAEWKREIVSSGVALFERRIASYLRDWEATEIILEERGKQVAAQSGQPQDDPNAFSQGKDQPSCAGAQAEAQGTGEGGEASAAQVGSYPYPESDPYAGGARTGYITRDFKGQHAERAVYQFDAALFRERRAIREQLARELGQWNSEDLKVSGKLELVKRIIGVADDAV